MAGYFVDSKTFRPKKVRGANLLVGENQGREQKEKPKKTKLVASESDPDFLLVNEKLQKKPQR